MKPIKRLPLHHHRCLVNNSHPGICICHICLKQIDFVHLDVLNLLVANKDPRIKNFELIIELCGFLPGVIKSKVVNEAPLESFGEMV